MTDSEFEAFRHQAVHALMELNARCQEDFRIGQWERWDYDLDSATLIFSDPGIPRVIANIQVVGTTSGHSKTWMWSWANESLPTVVTTGISAVREFGIRERVNRLTEAQIPDEEYLGWEMTAIAAQIVGAKGGYRCPSERGFLYLVYTDLSFADLPRTDTSATTKKTVACGTHGHGEQTFICEHLVTQPEQPWFSNPPTDEDRWPDAWCAQCERVFQEEGEWNDQNSNRLKIKLLCHRCYESLRARSITSAAQ
jgi:hypothetical protein